MIESELAKVALSHLSSLGAAPDNTPKSFKPSVNIKAALLESQPNFITKSSIESVVSVDEYRDSLLNELYFGTERIKQQEKNVMLLKNNNAQVAWVIVTAYYAAYFMAVDLSKASGRLVINLNETELRSLIDSGYGVEKNNVTVESNNTFFAIIEHGENQNEIKLRLKKCASKPHQMAWSNLNDVVKMAKINDVNRFVYFDLIKKILSTNTGWQLPSNIRNAWNYSHPNYYGSMGVELAVTFTSIISSSTSTYKWARNNTLRPSPANITATISFVYYLLSSTHSKLINRLNLNNQS